MLKEKTAIILPAGPDVRAWRNGSGTMPEWVHSASGEPCANGTFLLKTALGQQRVYTGEIVIEHCSGLYAWPAEEVDERMAELRERVAVTSRAGMIVGPGKSLKTAIPSRRRSARKGKPNRSRSYPPVRGVPPTIEWVLVQDLLVDGDYQRSIESDTSQRLIASIAAHWDWRLCMPLAISRRPEGRYVIDGQHRLEAAKLRQDIPHLPCCIATYDGPADEAAMFVAANRARRAISRLDDFHAALVAGDEDAIEIDRIVTKAGLRVSRQTRHQAWRPGEVAFTSSISSVLGKHGEELVLEALKAMAVAFQGQVLTIGAPMFVALTRILIRPPELLVKAQLFRSLKKHDVVGWAGFTKNMKGTDLRAQALRSAILSVYDKEADTTALAA